MSIFDVEETPQQITRDDLLRDNWSPDRLGRTWTKRLKVHSDSERFTKSFTSYLYFRYTIRNPHTKKRYELELINPEVVLDTRFNPVFKNIRTLQDIHLIIHSIARKICTNYRIEGPRVLINHGYDAWKEYVENIYKSTLNVSYRRL